MLRRSRRSVGRDDGFALVVALSLVLIVFILITAVLAQASFDLEQGGRVERRIKAINAAEAGLAWYMRQIESPKGSVRSLITKPWSRVSGSTYRLKAVAPTGTALNGATFEVEVWYLKADPCAQVAAGLATSCSTGVAPFAAGPVVETFSITDYATSLLPEPIYAMIRSTGTAGETSRTVESALRLHSLPSSGLPNTVVASSMCLGSGADVTLSGDVAFSTDSAFPTGYGCSGTDIVADGHKLTLASGEMFIKTGGFTATAAGTRVELHGLLWAGGAVRLGRNAFDLADGAVSDTSCGHNIKICAWSDVFGSSIAKGNNAAIMGVQSTSEGSPPLSGGFPSLTWTASDWSAKGWTVVDRVTWVDDHSVNWGATKTVYHITGGTCPFVIDEKFELPNKVAVVSDSCGFRVGTAAGFQGAGGVSLIVLGGGGCGFGGGNNIVLENGPTFGQKPSFFYTPCVLELKNNGGGILGQMYGRYLYFENPNSVTFTGASPESIPGPPSGFEVDVRYVREVTF